MATQLAAITAQVSAMGMGPAVMPAAAAVVPQPHHQVPPAPLSSRRKSQRPDDWALSSVDYRFQIF